MKAMISGIGLLFAASWFVAAQEQGDSAANRSKSIAFENAWNQAEERKDAKALDALMDNSLAEQQVTESMKAHVYGDAAVVTGVYRVKRMDQGKPCQRRGRFTDTWIHQNGTRVCVATQDTRISH
jgi:hypothetical protein